MHYLRKSKSSGDTPAPNPTPSAKVIRKLTSRKDPKALGATSSAIALSINSAFSNTPGMSSDGVTVQGTDTILQTTYAAVRMAVDITKESSDLFLPLKAVVGAVSVLMKNCDQTSDNTEIVKDIERKVQSLYGVLAAPVSEDDFAEKGRRGELRRKLDGIIMKLEPLSEEHALLKFLRNVDNAKTLSGFVEELAAAVTYYQVSLQQGMYETTRKVHDDTTNIRDDTKTILGAADLEILEKLEPVRNAGYQTGHHDECLPGTRQSVLRDLMLWAKNPQDRNVFWLNGLAGTGKSTIAQSFSEAITREGLLGASFFCSRDYLDRRELKNIFPTLAYQLACHYPQFQTHIISIIKNNPTLAHTSLISQLENLLVNPLSKTNISCVIVIDALDECIDNEPSSAILSVLGQFVKQLSLVKFFITGRPEPRIRTGFRLPLLQPITQIFLLHGVDSNSVSKDIQLYLTQKLTTIAAQRSDLDLPNPWPHGSEVEALTKKSSGLFIFAATMVRFIGSGQHEPNQRLQLLLSKAKSTIHEGQAGIDSLYSKILQYAFSDIHKPEEFADIRHVLGAIVLAFNPLSRRELSTLLGTPMSLISTILRQLHSVILVPSDESEKICIFHKSFSDFLQDKKRCANTRLHTNPEIYHSNMALSCLELVKELKRNPCSLPPFTMNQDIQDLSQVLESRIGGAVQYACTYWAGHIGLSPTSGDLAEQIIDLATKILQNAPPWIEVMSLGNQLGEVIHSMNSLLDWLDKVTLPTTGGVASSNKILPLHNLTTDCLRLSMHFFHPIQQCAQQIYYTALPLSPTLSHLRNTCLQSVVDDQLFCVTAFVGAPSTWGVLLRTIDTRPRQLTCITTSGQRIIAAFGDIVNIYDAVTGILQQPLSPSEAIIKIQASSDGTTLFFAHSSSVTMWDVQTGGLIHTFTTQPEVNNITLSTSEDYIACGSSDGSVVFWNIHTKEQGKHYGNGQPVVAICWLSPQKLAVATHNSLYICCAITSEILDTLSIPDHVWGMVYLWDKDEFLVGTSQPGSGTGQELYFLETISNRHPEPLEKRRPTVNRGRLVRRKLYWRNQSPAHLGKLAHPTIVGKEVAYITLPNGVRSFSTEPYDWTNNPPLLDAATSMAVSLNRNLVARTKDSIHIFSIDVLASHKVHNDTHVSRVYPLGKRHFLCILQPDERLVLLESETMQELHPDDVTLPFRSLDPDQTPSAHASPFPEFRTGYNIFNHTLDGEVRILCELSPARAKMVVVFRSIIRGSIWIWDTKSEKVVATLGSGYNDLENGEVYDITFSTETRFNLKVTNGPGQSIKISYDIIASPSAHYPYMIIKGGPMPLSELRATAPYTLDANCEWVLDAQSRKICWISPGNLRRGKGGHFWIGSLLVVVGDDGVVRKVSFKEPDC